MAAFLLYMLKTGICLTVFYLFFKAFLSNETFFRFNRSILIFGTIACFVVPLIKFTTATPSVIQIPFMTLEESLSMQDVKMIEGIPLEHSSLLIHEIKEGKSSSFDLGFVLISVFFSGLLINLFILLNSFFSMHRFIRHAEKTDCKSYKLILVEKNISPFSWYKYIIISKEDYVNHPNEIITHETAHIQHKHSFDLTLFELFVLSQWFNPAIWLLKKELKDIHEYQADIHVLQSGIDATRYQLLLVKKAVGSSSYTLANSFNHSKIKKRITMMLKEKSKKWTQLKPLLLVPLGAIALVAFSQSPVIEKEMADFPEAIGFGQDKSTTIISPDQKEKIEFYHVFIYNDKIDAEKRTAVKAVVKLTPAEYERFLEEAVQNFMDEREAVELKNYATSRGYWKGNDGRTQEKTITIYHELSGEQKQDLLKRERIAPPPPPFYMQQDVDYKNGTEFFLLVNAIGKVLFHNELVLLDDLEGKLSETLFKIKIEKKPIVLTIIDDKETKNSDLEKVFEVIHKAFSKNKKSANFENTFVRMGDHPREMNNRK